MERSHRRELVAAEPEGTAEFDRYAAYEEGDRTVICDRKTPDAWIKSTVAVSLDR